MVLYVPPNMAPLSNAPVMVWYVEKCSLLLPTDCFRRIHGGSFTIGSASEVGLDGSKLALATNSIVAVVQYRLGAVSATREQNLTVV
jgi:carboxylesterase type B